MNPVTLAEDALLEASRTQLQALQAELDRMDIDALRFDPDPAYRDEIKHRLLNAPYREAVKLVEVAA